MPSRSFLLYLKVLDKVQNLYPTHDNHFWGHLQNQCEYYEKGSISAAL